MLVAGCQAGPFLPHLWDCACLIYRSYTTKITTIFPPSLVATRAFFLARFVPTERTKHCAVLAGLVRTP